MNKRELLWIDDDIEQFSAFVKALNENGFIVTTASSCVEAEQAIVNKIFKVILVDINMPIIDGIETIKRISPKHSWAKFAVLSSFLYLQKYREQLALLNIPVQLIDKDFPSVQHHSFNDRFIKPIQSLAKRGVTYTLSGPTVTPLRNDHSDPFSIKYNEFMTLPITEKDALHDRAEEMTREIVNSYFQKGKVWVLVCGRKNEIVTSAEHFDEIPDEQKVLTLAQKYDSAPYQFCRSMKVEDHNWSQCPNKALKDYPTVSLGFGNDAMELHFDTGCPISMLSYEEFVARNIISGTTSFMLERRKGNNKSYRIKKVDDITAIIRSQKSDQTREIKISGHAVRDWKETSYARVCDIDCPIKDSYGSDDSKLCPLRRGLIGRNLLRDNQLSLVLDGAESKTGFQGE